MATCLIFTWIPWTDEEHKLFSVGLQKVDKGDWRGISRNYVKTRTPMQVASHAQKYFLCRSNLNRCRRRSSLFDITTDRGYFLLAIVRNVNVRTNLFHLKSLYGATKSRNGSPISVNKYEQYLSAVAFAVTTFGTVALMSGFFLKPVATLDDYLANVLPLFGGFLSILGVSELRRLD
ncbi:uncharacterized protein [Medicago truncatula]|uniref:uncharacterized protein n=1 Tax=Medicago truncatula TaxID=3880 RepID=UPI001967A527|nr:uncharacterized protein LOC25479879 [Medicago truncatula]